MVVGKVTKTSQQKNLSTFPQIRGFTRFLGLDQ